MSPPIVIRRLPPLRRKLCPNTGLAHHVLALACTLTPLLAMAVPAARAADLPGKAPTAPSYAWGGCYLGLNAGAGAGGSSFNTTIGPGTHLGPADAAVVDTAGDGSANATSWIGGGQAGCNWQHGTLVFGLEVDVDHFNNNPQFANGTNTLGSGNTFGVTQSLKTDYFATLRPRIGIAADRNLAYITGGAAFSNASYTQTYADANTPAGTGSASGSRSLVGWTAGAGWEHAWTNNWTFKLEYLFAEFPTTNALGSILDSAGGTNPLHGSANLQIQTLRVGMNYKF